MIEVKPDIEFKKQLKRISNSSLNECMQCGTCSVVCSLAPDDKPFPRKEMIWAGWGLKDKLIGNTDIWLCHQCGECSTYCPRGVKPADVFSAVRELSYQHYAKPKFLGKILNDPKWLAVAILIPVLIISAILFMAGTLQIPEGPVNYSKFFPHAWLNISFTFLWLLSMGLGILGLRNFLSDMKKQNPEIKPTGSFLKNLFSIRKEIILHSNFNTCSAQKTRKTTHLLVFYGFILLLFVTVFAIYAAVTHKYPLAITNPFKIIGNIAAIMLFAGLAIMIANRIFNKKDFGNSTYTDWLLLISLFLLTVSGVIVEAARFLNWGSAYHLYFFHLICVWFIIIYLPFTKFGHLLFRVVAMVFASSINRKLK
ncbi:MAG: quinone-interacting membrane-bound oxidoreductase complex subunit QmoC [Bacteroidales bacterium]|jgi:quinone-modifying oxidoreductase subunit QmoC|nr:quinone-interacting membrane-bound oxidoreductase complex subunit QmoC [Bacteroidales bacterium]